MEREAILSAWQGLTSTLGKQVVVTAGHETHRGFAEAIDYDGMLILRLPSGETKRISSGDLVVPKG
jgi:BirA family transcriptional regulator, biotin operon repressor / biotin---[acetyl-CoA-carboxylase] ligase